MPPPRTSAVALWSGTQCAALIVAACGIHLWPHQPDPPESIALAALVAIQIIAAAVLFPVVLADRATVVVNLAICIPLEQLAGLLSAVPQRAIWTASGYVALWVVGLAGWAHLARSDLYRSCLTGVAITLSLGGAFVWYVALEAAAQAGTPSPNPFRFGPLVAGLYMTVTSSRGSLPGWGYAAAPLVTALVTGTWFALRPTPK